jgi:hypothetical protein
MFGNNNSGIGGGIGSVCRVQGLKTCNISTNYKVTTGLTTAIPSSKSTGSPQITYTIADDQFPTITGNLPASVDFAGFLGAGCSNTNGSSARTLNWEVERNGVSIGSGSQSIAASNKGTLSFNSLSGTNKPVKGVADVFDIYLWCTESASDVQLIRHCLGIVTTDLKPVNDPSKLIILCGFSVYNYSAGLTGFTDGYSAQYTQRYHSPLISLPLQDTAVPNNTIALPTREDSSRGLVYNLITTAPANNVRTHASNYIVDVAMRLTRVQWRETNIRINNINSSGAIIT